MMNDCLSLSNFYTEAESFLTESFVQLLLAKWAGCEFAWLLPLQVSAKNEKKRHFSPLRVREADSSAFQIKAYLFDKV